MFAPPTIEPTALTDALRERGFGVLAPGGLHALLGGVSLDALAPSWDRLAPDQYLRDGGRYRSRRHGCFTVEPATGQVTAVAHRAHFQSVEYNALHGGIERWFEPLEPAVSEGPELAALLRSLGQQFAALRPVARWFVEVHQFRIDTAEGIGRPTPEGAHRDGVDFVAVALVNRAGIKGGETRVFDASGPAGVRFTMVDPWTTLLLDDERVIHESTPIQPTVAAPAAAIAATAPAAAIAATAPAAAIAATAATAATSGHRDTLVVTFRASAFQVAV